MVRVTVNIVLCDAGYCWIVYQNMGVNYGAPYPHTTIEACQAECIGNHSCTGIDMNWNNPVYYCYLLGPWSDSRVEHKIAVSHFEYQCRGPVIATNSYILLLFAR